MYEKSDRNSQKTLILPNKSEVTFLNNTSNLVLSDSLKRVPTSPWFEKSVWVEVEYNETRGFVGEVCTTTIPVQNLRDMFSK